MKIYEPIAKNKGFPSKIQQLYLKFRHFPKCLRFPKFAISTRRHLAQSGPPTRRLLGFVVG
ncbi:hypothetical protein AAMO2058_000538200 [Amorphochlora amoebiformis]